MPALQHVGVGCAGVSMGTAYGLPFVASDPRIRAAVLGMWGLDYPASEHWSAAAGDVCCDTLFLQRRDDKIFSRDGTAALFDAIAPPRKRLLVLPGPHSDLTDDALDAAVDFLTARMMRVQ